MKNIGIYLLVAIAGFTAYTYSKLAKSLTVTFKNLKFGGGLLSPKVEVTLGLQNPTNGVATLKSASGDIFLNDTLLSNFSKFEPLNIAANSETDLKITLKPNLLGTAQIIRDFIKNRGKGKYTVLVIGTANVDGTAINFKESKVI